jgi:hypothetical protein
MLDKTSSRVSISAHLLRDLAVIKANTKIEWQILTPERCEADKARSPGNRVLNKPNTAKIADALRTKSFRANGEPVCYDQDGFLIDGHHRFEACIQTGIPFISLVVYGLPRVVQKTIDTGRSRTFADLINIVKKATSDPLVANVTRAREFEAVLRAVVMFAKQDTKYPFTADLGYSLCDFHGPRLVESIINAVTACSSCGIGRNYIGGIHAIATFTLGRDIQANQFADVLAMKIGPVYDGDPAHAALARLTKNKKLSREERARILANAWNNFAKGKSIRASKPRVDFMIDGFHGENFMDIKLISA